MWARELFENKFFEKISYRTLLLLLLMVETQASFRMSKTRNRLYLINYAY